MAKNTYKNMVKKRILAIIIAFVAIASSATAQTLSVSPIEVQAGQEAELVISVSGLRYVTALQFNILLPDGINLSASDCTLGTAASMHELDIRPLETGAYLFVFYHMDKTLITDGELIRIPLIVGSEATTSTGELNQFCTATADAVSHERPGRVFTITVKAPAELKCSTPVLIFTNGKVRCTCETEGVKYQYTITPATATGESTDGLISLGTTFTVSVKAVRDGYADSETATLTIPMSEVGDVNGDGSITIADVTALVNRLLGK